MIGGALFEFKLIWITDDIYPNANLAENLRRYYRVSFLSEAIRKEAR